MREDMGEDFKLFIHLRNKQYRYKKGWFNDQFLKDETYKLSGDPDALKMSKRNLLTSRLNMCKFFANDQDMPTLGIYVNCLELIEKWKKINQTSTKKEEINTSKTVIQNSENKADHEKCLKATDYAGCMRYQNK